MEALVTSGDTAGADAAPGHTVPERHRSCCTENDGNMYPCATLGKRLPEGAEVCHGWAM